MNKFYFTTLTALFISCVGYADWDVEFLSNPGKSTYTIIVTDEFENKTFTEISEKEFITLIDNPQAQSILINKIVKSVNNTGF